MAILDEIGEVVIPVCISECNVMLDLIYCLNNPYYFKDKIATFQRLRVRSMKSEKIVREGLQSAILLGYIEYKGEENYSLTDKGIKITIANKSEKQKLLGKDILDIESYYNILLKMEEINSEIKPLFVENELNIIIPGIDERLLKKIFESFISFVLFTEFIESNTWKENQRLIITQTLQNAIDVKLGKIVEVEEKSKTQKKSKKIKKKEDLEINIPVCSSDCNLMMDIVFSLNNPYYFKKGKATPQRLRVVLMKTELDVKRGIQSANLFGYISQNSDKTFSITDKGKNLIIAKQLYRKEIIGNDIFNIETYKNILSLTDLNGGEAKMKEIEDAFSIVLPGINKKELDNIISSFLSFGYFSEIIVPNENEIDPGIKTTERLKIIIEKIQRDKEKQKESDNTIDISEITKKLTESINLEVLNFPLFLSDCSFMFDIIEVLNNPYFFKDGNASLQRLHIVLLKDDELIKKGLQTAILCNYIHLREDNTFILTDEGKRIISLIESEKKEIIAELLIKFREYKEIFALIQQKKGEIQLNILKNEFKKKLDSIKHEEGFLDNVVESFISFGYMAEIMVPDNRRDPGIRFTSKYQKIIDHISKQQETAKKEDKPIIKRSKTGICGACGGGIMSTFHMCPYCGNPLARSEEEEDFKMIFVKRFFAKSLKEMDISQLRGIFKILSPTQKTNRKLNKIQLIEYIESKQWLKKEVKDVK
ncbi:MAG: hypothetical protein GY870_20470 [archaeon]|nr:hypothetical protein [archaeon]